MTTLAAGGTLIASATVSNYDYNKLGKEEARKRIKREIASRISNEIMQLNDESFRKLIVGSSHQMTLTLEVKDVD